jgi:hypothetical protein
VHYSSLIYPTRSAIALSLRIKAQILAELLASTIHLQVHCGKDFQDLIAEEVESLPDDDELD